MHTRRFMGDLRQRISLSVHAMRRILGNQDLRRLEIAWVLATASAWGFLVALLVYSYGVGGSLAVGVLGLFRTLPTLVGVPIASSLGDRYPRVRVLLGAYLVSFAAAAAAAAGLAMSAPLLIVFVLAGVNALSVAAIRPLQSSLLPALARSPDELVAANVATSAGEGIGVLLGPAIAGLLVAFGPAAAAAAAAAGMGFATIGLGRVRPGFDRPRAAQAGRRSRGSGTARRLLALPGPMLLMAVFGFQPFVRGLLTVLVVVASIELLGLGEPGVGLLNSAIGLGGILGATAAIALVGRQRLVPFFWLGLVLWGVPIAVTGLVPLATVAVVGMVVIGAANALLDVSGFTLLERTIPNDIRAGALGLFEADTQAMAGLGGVVAPLLVAAFGVQGALVATGLILPVLATVSLPRLRRVDDLSLVPVRELALLRGVPMFATLPMTTIEQLADALVPTRAEAGQALMREGEIGDRFYVVDAGTAEVTQGGQPIRTIGPGEYVGEIALLRGVPRTATVTATSELRAFVLDSASFIAAVTNDVEAIASAREVVEARLANATD
jgi:MFS family permease